MSDEHKEQEEEGFEVVELESAEGESEEFVILDRVEINDETIAVMLPLEYARDSVVMSTDELQDFYGEDAILVLMREGDDEFTELTEEDYESIKDQLAAFMAAQNDED